MTTEVEATAPWWSAPPPHQVTYLAGVDPDLLGIALDPLPEHAPAVVQFRPAAALSLEDQVGTLLSELDTAARALFPRWLPDAGRFDGSGTLGVAAVRDLARRTASNTVNFGPFLADLAERSVGGHGAATTFPAEVRAAGLARVIADAYQRDTAALLIVVPPGLRPEGEHAFAGAATWFADRGRFAVWLAGPPLVAVDRFRTLTIALPEAIRRLTARHEPDRTSRQAIVRVPPLAGVPRSDSPAELALERALAGHAWADGRQWNRTYHAAGLSRPYRLDLCWLAEQVIIEVDGDDHRQRVKWVDDRDRDVHLQMNGFQVLRFPNEDVEADVQLVVRKIAHVLHRRRAGTALWK